MFVGSLANVSVAVPKTNTLFGNRSVASVALLDEGPADFSLLYDFLVPLI